MNLDHLGYVALIVFLRKTLPKNCKTIYKYYFIPECLENQFI